MQVFAVVEKAGTVVMNDGEELDSWSVLINGHVEIEHANGNVEHLHLGDRCVPYFYKLSIYKLIQFSTFKFYYLPIKVLLVLLVLDYFFHYIIK